MNARVMTRNESKFDYLVHMFPEKFEDFIIRTPPENLPNGFHFDYILMECWVELYPDKTFSVTKEKPDTTNNFLFINKTCFSKYAHLNGILSEQKKSRFPGTNLT